MYDGESNKNLKSFCLYKHKYLRFSFDSPSYISEVERFCETKIAAGRIFMFSFIYYFGCGNLVKRVTSTDLTHTQQSLRLAYLVK